MGALNRFELDHASRTNADGTVLLGGSPLSMFRLTPTGKRLIERIRSGEDLPPGHEPLTKRLVAAGAIHPVYDRSDTADADTSTADVTLVIPAFNADPNRLAELVRRSGCGRAIVVDDASPQPLPHVEGAEVLRLSTNGGPGVARQHGLDLVSTPFVAFVDADVTVGEGWVRALLPCSVDDGVALAAPRIRADEQSSGAGWVARSLARFESVRGPLDLGPIRGRIRSTTRVSYVPSAALVCRVAALRQVGGFDPALRLGEDVDLVWRLDEAGWSCRYEPTTELWHDVRPSLASWVRQRAGYGFSATDLALRHPGSVAPVQSSVWSAAAWALVAAGLPITGCAVAAGSTAALARKLPETSDRALLALRLAGLGHLHAGRTFAIALTRSWWPVTVAAALVSRRARRVAVAAALIPSLLDWWAVRRSIDPARYLGLRLVDDGAYGFGLWRGALARRSTAALRPRLTGWPRRKSTTGATRTGDAGASTASP